MPNWVTIKPASDNFDPSSSNVGGNWVTVKPANPTPAPTPPEPSAFEKIGTFVDGIANFAKELPGMVLSPIVKTGLSIGELVRPENIFRNPIGPTPTPTDTSVNVFGNKVTSIQRSGYERNAAYANGDITKEQLAGGALLDSIDVATTLLAPLEGILVNAGKKIVLDSVKRYGPETFGEIFREGSRIFGQQGIDEALKKGGGRITAEATDTIIKQGMESLGKQGILKGDKLVSLNGLKNIATNPLVAGGTGYGAGYGLATGMQQNQGALDLAKSTSEGALAGVGGGIALHTIGKIIGGAINKISNSVTNKRAGTDLVAEARNTIKATEDLLGHKLGSTETKQITKSIFGGAKKNDVIKSIINEADNSGVNLDTRNIVSATSTQSAPDATLSGIFDAPETAKVSSEIVSARTPDEVKPLIPDFVPEADRIALTQRLALVKNPDEVANILDGYNPKIITEKVSTKISKTDNPTSIEKMITGIVPEKEMPSVAKDLSSMKDPVQIANVLDGYKPKVEVQATPKETLTKETPVVEPKTKVQGYTGTGEATPLQGAVTFNEYLVKNGIAELKDIPEHKTVNFDDQEKFAKELYNSDPEKLIRIATLNEHSNDLVPMLAAKIIIASEDKTLISRFRSNYTINNLAERARATGQENAAFARLKQDDPLRVAFEMIDSRLGKLKKVDNMVVATKKIDKEINMTKVQISIKKAQNILDNILCK